MKIIGYYARKPHIFILPKAKASQARPMIQLAYLNRPKPRLMWTSTDFYVNGNID